MNGQFQQETCLVSGIAGFIDMQRSRESAAQLIDHMYKIIRHRGPDDQGVWTGDGIALCGWYTPGLISTSRQGYRVRVAT